MNQNPRYIYEPQKDITAYEIAQILPVLISLSKQVPNELSIGKYFLPSLKTTNAIENLPDEAKRHFKNLDYSD